MTPQGKAKELFNQFFKAITSDEMGKDFEVAKQCVLIAVDEIIKEHYPQDIKRCQYWQEVVQEIENL